MSDSNVFVIQAYGCEIQVAIENREMRTLVERYLLPGLPRTEPGSSIPDVQIQLRRISNEMQLLVGQVVVAAAGSAEALIPELINVIDEAVVNHMKGLYAVHAGAVLLRDRALILPGASHCGKSSLVAELLRHGAKCFSDEYALIDVKGRVHPYGRPLLLRNERKEQTPTLPDDRDFAVANASAEVGWILALKYQSGGSWNIEPIPQSMAMLSLLQNTPHALADSPDMVNSFQLAVTHADCYAGHRGETGDAVEKIFKLVGM